MLGIGWTEMLVIGVAALIVIGPKDLPIIMKRVGQFVGQVRRMGAEFQREINRTTGLDEVKNLRKTITDPLRKSSEEIRREFNAMTPKGQQPSGLIKPSEPGKESVADEIRAAAGMPPATSQSAEAADAAEPVKPARATRKSLAVERDEALKAQAAISPDENAAPPAPRRTRSRARPKPDEIPPPAVEPAKSPNRPKRTGRAKSGPAQLAQPLDAPPLDVSPKKPRTRRQRAPTAVGDAPSAPDSGDKT